MMAQDWSVAPVQYTLLIPLVLTCVRGRETRKVSAVSPPHMGHSSGKLLICPRFSREKFHLIFPVHGKKETQKKLMCRFEKFIELVK